MARVVFRVPVEVPDDHLHFIDEDPFGYLVDGGIGDANSWEVTADVYGITDDIEMKELREQ